MASFVTLCSDPPTRVASLQALTNLSVVPTYHVQFKPLMSSFVDVATNSSDINLMLQSLRLLANLTFSSEFAEQMLNDKVCICVNISQSVSVLSLY